MTLFLFLNKIVLEFVETRFIINQGKILMESVRFEPFEQVGLVNSELEYAFNFIV